MNMQFLNQLWLAIYPVAAVSSQSLLDLSTVLMFLTTMWLFRKKKIELAFKKIGIEWAFASYLGVVIIGYMTNAAADADWVGSLVKFSWLINIYILIYAFQSLQLKTIRIIQIISTLTFGPTLYSLLSYARGVDIITGRDNTRLTGLVNSSTYHAHGNAVLFIILVSCLYFSIKKLNLAWQIFSFFSTILLGLSIFLTFTRGIWISIFISSVLVLLFLDWKKLFYFIFGSAILFGLFFQVSPKFKDRILMTNVQSNEERISLFKVNVQIWKEYPLLGIGYGENLRRNREYWDRPEWRKPTGYITSHAHNQFLNVLSSTGILGLFFFSSILIFFFRKNLLLIRSTSSQSQPERYAILLTCLWAQLEFLLACLSDVSFEYVKIRALILLVWALVIAIEQKPEIVIEEKNV